MSFRTDTERRYREATQLKYGRAFSDEQWASMSRDFITKRRCHYAVAKNLAAGIIPHLKCAICGSNHSEAHHPDYSYPLAVVWLCRSHHKKEHAILDSLDFFSITLRRLQMLDFAKATIGEPSGWSIQEAMRGEAFPEFDWGSEDDYLDTIVEYDHEHSIKSHNELVFME